MALVQCDFFSYELGMNTQLNVILPEHRHAQRQYQNQRFKILYALHGHAQDHTNWQRDGILEHYLKEENVIVAMPNVHRSFYTDGKHGYRYFSFITKELPIIMHNYFPVSPKREDQFIAGNSMGGYGAVKAALLFPQQYAGAACLSGAIDPYQTIDLTMAAKMFSVPDIYRNLDDLFGSAGEFEQSETNNLYLAAKALEQSPEKARPKIFHCCGTEDILYPLNQEFHKRFPKLAPSIPYHYEESAGAHDWNYWNQAILSMLRYFGLCH